LKLAPLIVAGLVAACSQPTASKAQSQPQKPAPTAAPAGPQLAFPVACVIGSTCEVQNYVDHDPGPGAKDYRCASNTYDAHSGVDIRLLDLSAQAAGFEVLAAAPGTVARLRDGVPDISIRDRGADAVNGQECGNGVVIDHGDGWETQYCHLANGSVKVRVGDQVAAGTPLARIGLSGQTEYPHMHMTVRKAGVVVDPFAPELAPGACAADAAGRGMWTPEAAKAMVYKPGAVLNAGFTSAPVTMASIEAGSLARPTNGTPLIAYVRAINLRGGDVQELTIRGPDGQVVAASAQPPLDRAKAQYMFFVGKRAAAGAWPSGRYQAAYVVRRDGKTVINQTFAIDL
jgi:murein DD-endopeptidase MepM/ murein hydrolase activator NlpD